MIYVSLFLVLLLLSILVRGQSTRRRLYFFALVLLFLFSAFRFEVGCDWTGYLNQWWVQENSLSLSRLDGEEPLWWGAIAGLQALHLSYPWLNVVSSAVFFVGLNSLARRQPDPLVFLTWVFPILIMNMSMSAIKQGTAIGVMCFAYGAFLDKKLLKFVAFTLLAACIHKSAAVFLMFCPFIWGEYSKSRLVAVGILALPGVFALANSSMAEEAANLYVNTGVDALGAPFRVSSLLMTALIYLFSVGKAWKNEDKQEHKLLTISSTIICILAALLPISSVIGDRLGYYFIPLQALIISRLQFFEDLRQRYAFLFVSFVFLLGLFVSWTVLSSHYRGCYEPYRSWILWTPRSRLIYLN